MFFENGTICFAVCTRKENLPVATKMAEQVICLPMHHALSEDDMERVLRLIRK